MACLDAKQEEGTGVCSITTKCVSMLFHVTCFSGAGCNFLSLGTVWKVEACSRWESPVATEVQSRVKTSVSLSVCLPVQIPWKSLRK
jgi:hypothetical protein